MKIRFFENKTLIAEFKAISPDDTLKLLKRHSKTPELLPDDPTDLWSEGQQQTNHGHMEWSTEKELTHVCPPVKTMCPAGDNGHDRKRIVKVNYC